MGELRKAAAEGQAYYCCERFEDQFGRLIVGIGARLDGRILRTVAKSGRQSVYASPVSLYDGLRFQGMLAKTQNRPENKQDSVQEMYRAFAQVQPQAASKIAALNPRAEDLDHGLKVGRYVRRLMSVYNDIQTPGSFRFSAKDIMRGFVSGVVHDIGSWGHLP
jgi:hypothetical protein